MHITTPVTPLDAPLNIDRRFQEIPIREQKSYKVVKQKRFEKKIFFKKR